MEVAGRPRLDHCAVWASCTLEVDQQPGKKTGDLTISASRKELKSLWVWWWVEPETGECGALKTNRFIGHEAEMLPFLIPVPNGGERVQILYLYLMSEAPTSVDQQIRNSFGKPLANGSVNSVAPCVRRIIQSLDIQVLTL
ncbi:hypothetical protein BV898_13818 [Hypsibius exemplaris]|uniref:Uncharacterized protein n=1 Tax=Hypsibius exemplaris TaxID=2072580 RepID=A0A1W0W9W2_HYPEX|nr:hypothetical protein BV898_13818 [Hypsibius exemplaris]